MRRHNRLIAIAMTAMIVIPAIAEAQVKTLIMPGEVIEGHAEFEKDCDSCHAAFERGKQRDLCLDCHEEVALDITSSLGYHGKFPKATDAACSSCHTDHEGRDAEIIDLNRQTFQHRFTDFELAGKHAQVQCDGCHEPEVKFRDAPGACFDCHEDDNVHAETMGTECGDCHSPSGWLDVEFDHGLTGFSLIGKHVDVACLDCHEDETFVGASTTCNGCHAADDVHEGRSGQQCENCHSPVGWDDTRFNHARDTDFPLDGHHVELTCGDCHSDDPFADELEMACVSCHLEDDNHEGHFGGTCETCHVTSEWATVTFDHDKDTDYEIHGAHAELECTACHVEPVFDVALESGCNDCHAKDDPHDGSQGSACQDCHNEVSWADEVFFDHGLTRFPLLGAHSAADCDQCHESKVFGDAPTACVDCHRDKDPHKGRFDDNCANCHNPVDWLVVQFDHDLQTDFVLDGAHASVACETCHRQSLQAQTRLGQRCGDCHRADDVHDGEFGFDCGRCHSSDSFNDVRTIQ